MLTELAIRMGLGLSLNNKRIKSLSGSFKI